MVPIPDSGVILETEGSVRKIQKTFSIQKKLKRAPQI